MAVLEWMRRRQAGTDARSKRDIDQLTERVTRLNPRLRLVSHYQRRLRPSLEQALAYVHDIVVGFPAPLTASCHAWGTDPYIHAFFATPDEVELTFSRSPELREFFTESPDTPTAFAVLGMSMSERRTLGVALEGDVLRSDVPQTNINFSDRKITIIASSDAALREEIVRRIFDQLTLEGMGRYAAGKSRRDVLDREQTLLLARLRLLERQGTGLRSVVGSADSVRPADKADKTDKADDLREHIAKNEAELAQLAPKTDVLDCQLDCLIEAFQDARNSFTLARTPLRLSATNVLLAPDSTAPSTDIDLLTAHIPGDPPLVRSFSLVRFARGDMLSSRALLDEAERLL